MKKPVNINITGFFYADFVHAILMTVHSFQSKSGYMINTISHISCLINETSLNRLFDFL